MRKKLIISSLICFFLLAACADSDNKDDTADDTAKAPTPICPQVVIVRDLENISDYGRENPDPSQLVARARMKSIDGDCAYLPNGIDIRFSLNFVAAKGPRLGGLHTSFPYFVALVDPDNKIITKDRMTKEFGFSSSEQVTEDEEDLHVFIPLAKDKKTSGPDYKVLVGFQLSEDQLKTARNGAGSDAVK